MFDLKKSPSLWERVRNDDCFKRHRDEIKKQYDEVFKVAPRPRSASEVLNNNDHEIYFRSIRQLQSSAILALIYPDNEEYYNSLVDIVWAYCNEYSWAPLGHYNEYYDRTPKDYDVGLIDIFAASIAFSMAEIKDLFKDRFPKLLTDRITAEIRRRTIEPYLTRKYFWEKHDNNWTAVCTGAVGGVLMYEAPELFIENQERIHKSMECYLASYNDDGMCVEGTAYWGFGFGFFASFAMLEREFTGGEVDWFKRPLVRAISKYVQKMFLQKDVMAMFGDCNIKEGYWIGLPHMLKEIYPEDIECLPTNRGTICAYAHLCFSLRSFVYFNPDYVCDVLESKVYSLPNSAFFTKRTNAYGFSAKGGNNGESHNHKDVGSFILARNNKQILCDLGYMGPAPCPDYHGSKRYTYFNPSSFSHNVPYFDENGQSGIRRDDVFAVYDEEKSTVYMEFARAYDTKGLEKLERLFQLDESRIVLTDTYHTSSQLTITERFVTEIKPLVQENTITIDDVKLTILSKGKLNIVNQPYVAQLPDENGSYNQICYCIDFILDEGENKFEMEIEMPNA